MGILGLVAAVGLSLVGPQFGPQKCRAEDEGGAGEEAAVSAVDPSAAGVTDDAIDDAAANTVSSAPDADLESAATSDAVEGAEGSPAAGNAGQPAVVTGQTNGTDAEPEVHDAAAAGLRVRVRLEVTGELFTAPTGEGAALREPVAMNARFDFDERPRDDIAASARYYRDATAALDLAGQKTTTALAPEARRLLVARRGTTPAAYLEDGFLTGDEADLLETPFESLLLDDLLPTTALRLEERWDVAADLTAGLLAIDTVESGGLTGRIVEVTDGRAKVALEGIVDGAADGVATHVTVEGSFIVSVTTVPGDDPAAEASAATFVPRGRVSQATVVLRERRQPSHVAPGFDVEARVVVARGPLDKGAAADAAAGGGADGPDVQPVRRRGVGAPGRLWHRDPAGRFDLVHDARWKRVEDGPHGLVLRLIDHGALVGQCSISCLPGAPSAEPLTMADVRRDFERSLSGQVSRIDAAEETERADGVRVVRLEAVGTAGGLTFRWMHHVLAGPSGGRASVTFMCEEPLRKRFGAADLELVEGFRLLAGGDGAGSSGPTASRPAHGAGARR
jgi:hypothetical protein